MSDIQIIETVISRAARRRRFQSACRGLWIGLFAASCLWLGVLIAYKLAPLPDMVLSVTGAISAAFVPAGFLIGSSRGSSLLQTARWVDDQQHFQERLSTAIEVAKSEKAGRWRELLLNDAAAFARRLDVRKSIPFQLPILARWSALVLLLAATLGFVPEYRSKSFLQKKRE